MTVAGRVVQHHLDIQHQKIVQCLVAVNTVIGYGPDSSNKIPTYYFRTTFEVEDLAKIGDIGHINFGIDDSVILYLNGHEIGRHNLPEGEIGYDKYLSDLTGSSVADESRYETFTLDAADLAHLVEGTNVLAAEVHQDRPTSSDIYWDMEFITTVNKETRRQKNQLFLKKYMIIKIIILEN